VTDNYRKDLTQPGVLGVLHAIDHVAPQLGEDARLERSLAAMIDVILALRSRRPASVIGFVQKLPNRMPLDGADSSKVT